MVATLNGIRFDQIYGDNTGGAEFDADGDGTTTQEDEFVSFTNTTGSNIDVSGWEIWTDSTGAGAYGAAQEDGLYHVFPPGTIIEPGKTLYVFTEYTGTPPPNVQEASTEGSETATVDSNRLSEGASGSQPEALALVNPATGDFIVFNMSDLSSEFAAFDGGGSSSDPDLAGFPGSNMVAEIDGHAVQDDMNAGSSYQYDSVSDSYVYSTAFVACFAAGTRIKTPRGEILVERLKAGDPVMTVGNGPRPIRLVVSRRAHPAADKRHAPVLFEPDSLGPGQPLRRLALSPQHRVLVRGPDGQEVLCPAKGFLKLPGCARDRANQPVHYFNLLLDTHEILLANAAPVESMFLAPYGLSQMHPRLRHALVAAGLLDKPMKKARRFIRPKALTFAPATSPLPS